MNINPYMYILSKRFLKGKLSAERYRKLISHLMRWSFADVKLSELWDEEWDFDEDEKDY